VAKLPGIPGIETFAGHSFHTSRWDYTYTGGDPDGAPMDRLAGRRIAIIGTGATAVQFLADCTPGYYNNEGQFDGRQFPLGGGYHKGAPAYFRFIRQWRISGDFAGLEFSRR
jgi:hypothetical protein